MISNKRVVLCGVDTSSLPKLTASKSIELLNKIKQGDRQARNYFINCNLRLVLSVVKRYSERYNNADDLFQIGCVGLIKSVDNFDTSVGVQFSTYAVPMIAGEIRRFLRESNSLRVSRGIRDVAYLALQTRDELENQLNGEVTVDCIAEKLGMPVSKIVYCLDAVSEPVSLNDTVYGDEEDTVTVGDKLADDKCNENVWADNVSLQDAINCLDKREKDILIMRYFEGKTQVEVSKAVGLSQAQVSRLEKNAVDNLRQNMA